MSGRFGRAALVAALVASAWPVSARAMDLDDEDEEPPRARKTAVDPNARRPGELVLLYMTGIAWGGSIGVFIDAAQYVDRPAASVDPGVLLAPLTAGVGCLLPTVVDVAYGKRRGAANTVSSAMLLGLGEAIALNEYFSNRASTSFHTYTKDAAWVFGGMTAGLATGLTVAAMVRTTPGRAAWVETTGLFGGLFVASLTGAVSRSSPTFGREDIRDVGLAGAIAGAAGITVGLSTATALSPSVLRVHLIDLGWILPTVVAGIACAKCNTPDTFTAMAIAGGAGFAGAFAGTMTLPQTGLAPTAPRGDVAFAPFALPLPTGGFEVGVGGSL